MGIFTRIFGQSQQHRSIIGVDDVADAWLRPSSVNADTALGIPAAWRGVNLIASTAARLPLPVYRRTDEGRERQRQHPADRLLNLWSDPATPAYSLRRAVTVDALLHGNGFALIQRDNANRPTALSYLPGGHVRCMVKGGTRFYEYQTPTGGTVRYAYADVLHVPGFPGGDGWAGVGFVEVANQALETIDATLQFTRQFYGNKGRPSVVVKVPTKTKPEERIKTRDSFLKYFRPENAGRPMVTSTETEVQELGMGESAISALEGLRNHDLISIANLLGLPPHLVGAKSTVYKSLEQENRNLVMFGLDPWLIQWEKSIGLLFTESDRLNGRLYAEHTRQALYQTDTIAQSDSLIRQVAGGLLTTNEARGISICRPSMAATRSAQARPRQHHQNPNPRTLKMATNQTRIEVPTRFEIVRGRDGGDDVLRGTASVTYDGRDETQYRLDEYTVERIAPGAFARALSDGHDVVALFNHDHNQLLGRTPNTLRLSADDEGLHYEIDLPQTGLGRDVRHLIDRGDLRGSSFAFRPARTRWTRDGDTDVFEVLDLDLIDVSPVTRPAYQGTAVRMRDDRRDELTDEARDRRETRERSNWLGELA